MRGLRAPASHPKQGALGGQRCPVLSWLLLVCLLRYWSEALGPAARGCWGPPQGPSAGVSDDLYFLCLWPGFQELSVFNSAGSF